MIQIEGFEVDAKLSGAAAKNIVQQNYHSVILWI